MTISETIKDLHEVFDGTPWFGSSLSSYVQEIRSDMLNFSLDGGNSVGQIIHHMIHWRLWVINKIEVELGQTSSISIEEVNTQDWPEEKFEPSDKNVLIAQLRDTQKVLLSILEKTSDDIMDKIVDGRDYNFAHMLKGVMNHDIYHLGQLYLLVSAAKRTHRE